MANSKTVRVKTGYGNLYLTLTEDTPARPLARIGKNGSDPQVTAEVICRLAYLAMEHGAVLDEVCKELVGLVGEKPLPRGATSIPDAIAKGLRRLTTDGEAEGTAGDEG